MNRVALLLLTTVWAPCVAAGEWSGHIAGELRLFPSSGLYDGQRGNNLTLSIEPEYYHEWDDGHQRFTFHPFLRLDAQDPERAHGDIRELYWEKVAERWELRVGIRRVFWGVTESQHLVDIINQTDLVENIDTEVKLGQPMVNLALVRDWGTVDFFLLPGFRERTFPGTRGRLRPPIPVDTDAAEYESGAENLHVDWAVRWSHAVGDWDVGLSHFAGTSREPRLETRINLGSLIKLVPYYDQIHQTGLDAQLTKGGWLWKLEAIHRSGQGETFSAVTAGFEYTFFGAFGTDADVGLLAEYLYDSRGESAPVPFENDVFIGTRVGLNDTNSTQLLAGIIIDPDTGASAASLEFSRRLRENWRLNLELRAFSNQPESDPGYPIRKDDYVQLELAWFF